MIAGLLSGVWLFIKNHMSCPRGRKAAELENLCQNFLK